MTDLPDLVAPAGNRPKTALDQHDVQAWEEGLLALARVRHPTVSWWHGYRRHGEAYADYCYICDAVIVEMTSNGNPSVLARLATDDHKWDHHDGALPVVSINEKEAPAS